MKISHSQRLIDEGSVSDSTEWQRSREEVLEAVRSIYWPSGEDRFIIRPEEDANGVNPITDAFETNLDRKDQWEATGRTYFKTVLQERNLYKNAISKLANYYDQPDDIIASPWFDAVKTTGDDSNRLIAVEWETGNISSSHRSLNRLALGLVTGLLSAGIVVLPTRDLYHYLTDRVGNFTELEPYFFLWELLGIEVESGVLEVIAVEHDATGDVPPVGKMTDGMSDREHPEVNLQPSKQESLDDFPDAQDRTGK